MDLSLLLIKEKLSDIAINYNIGKDWSNQYLPRPVFFTGEMCLHSNTLSIAHREQLPEELRFQEGAALICIGKPSPSYYNDTLSLLVIDEQASIFEVSNRIHEIYDFFEIWDVNLQKGIREHKSLQFLLDLSEPIFQNGMSIMNPDYYIIARTATTLDFNLIDEIKTDESGRLSLSMLNQFKNDLGYQKIKDEKAVFFYPPSLLPYRTLCKNIFHNQTFLFRIVVFENIRPFTEGDQWLLEYLGNYLTADSEYLAAVNQSEHDGFMMLLKEMVMGNAFHQGDLERELKRLGWSQQHLYCVAHMLPSDQDIYNQTLTYFCNKIIHDFRDAFAFIIENRIIVLFNLNFLENREDYFGSFNRFIREGGFKVGYSNEATGLKGLKAYHKEAEIALELGAKARPDGTAFKFCDYVLTYLLNQMTSELSGTYLQTPILTRLETYDQNNGSDYVKTLTVYLKNNMNALKTAKELCIHRGTMVYRLDRIKEIGKIDFDNSDDLLHVYISLMLMGQNQVDGV